MGPGLWFWAVLHWLQRTGYIRSVACLIFTPNGNKPMSLTPNKNWSVPLLQNKQTTKKRKLKPNWTLFFWGSKKFDYWIIIQIWIFTTTTTTTLHTHTPLLVLRWENSPGEIKSPGKFSMSHECCHNISDQNGVSLCIISGDATKDS